MLEFPGCRFQVQSKLPAEVPAFKADYTLVGYAIQSIGRLIGQIHPTNRGWINISLGFENEFAKLTFYTNREQDVDPLDENPDLFIVQAVARLHEGEFMVENKDDHCMLTFSLSTTKFSQANQDQTGNLSGPVQ